MATDTGVSYDRYWEQRDSERTAARSRERGETVARLVGPAAGRRLVDVGCGPGWALEVLARAGFRARGVEVSVVAAAEAERRGLEVRRLDLEQDDVERAWEGEDPPDVIVALEVLEHLLDPLATLRRLAEGVARGGSLVVSLPNEVHVAARLRMLLGRLPFGGHDDPHIRHFDRRSAARLFEAAELRVVRSAAIGVCPPRWRLVRRLAAPLVRWLPGLFAIAIVYELRRGDDR